MKQLTLRIPDELYEEAKRIAEREGFSFNAFAIQAFNYYGLSLQKNEFNKEKVAMTVKAIKSSLSDLTYEVNVLDDDLHQAGLRLH